MQNIEIEKSKPLVLNEIIEYVFNSVIIKNIFRRNTGNINVIAMNTGKILTEKPLAFDMFVQIIDGEAEVIINGQSNLFKTEEVILIPAHSAHIFKANLRFKMITTVIKSGNEAIAL